VNRFTSFVKTRILCSVPGTIPFDYNEIRKFYKYTRTTLLLGVFRFLSGGGGKVWYL